jgi:putative membrane protein
MPPGVRVFLQRWLINTLAVLVAVCFLGDARIHYDQWQDLLIASLLLGIFNAFLRPLLLLLSLPLLIVTLGLFTLIVNALLLDFVGWLLQPHFRVADFWSAFWGAFIISLVSLAINSLTGTGPSHITIHRGKPPGGKSDDNGPVIDI